MRVACEAAQVASAPAGAAAGDLPAALQLRLQFGVKNIPHPNKAHYGGEDAFFVSELGGGAAGIADGVGGWQESGINPADYSKSFMATARQYLEECASLYPEVLSSGEWRAQQEQQAAADGAAAAAEPAPTAAASSLASVGGGEPRTAVEALDAAHRSTRLPGSATACVLRLDGRTGELDAANLGDSGFLVIRDGQLHFQSPAMQHFFDCPLQFGMPPDTDYAQDAAVFSLQLQPGDAIVLATDGLLDNLPQEEIVGLAPRSAGEDGKLELGKLRGGKMDDITVVCAYVTHAEQQA
ncbi:hypothetical protein CHLNCDRAFT_135009 [Chlorella variabilis]|uniref:Protein phosphatase n=1 Tax=Chlorella variabilis TaxID=554065 RepID=E1ZHC4_CHLVA|nr:hypothetical protein CHLNCDRAFT_135009 [Chlorella variabilis]EFN54891.1 hypothetical protein CHLNCDRAFT_135009 [Chlorella variabilis]|eukprot:XP_005846993.1 hypothetical protein CHLNCDRAFT_135009 [Chlorella variabilis]